MTLADWIIVAVILGSTIEAAIAGFFQVAFGIGGLVFGYLFATWRYQWAAGWYSRYLKSPEVAQIAGFLTILIAVAVLAGILGRVARWLVKKSGLSFFDRVLGALLGFLRGCLSVAIVLVGITAFTPASKWLESSQLAPYFLVVGRAAIWMAPSELRNRFYQGLDLVRQVKQPPHPAPRPSGK
jgi:membrane protein required for colicin V production